MMFVPKAARRSSVAPEVPAEEPPPDLPLFNMVELETSDATALTSVEQ
jgi:hypothetical protein